MIDAKEAKIKSIQNNESLNYYLEWIMPLIQNAIICGEFECRISVVPPQHIMQCLRMSGYDYCITLEKEFVVSW